MRELPESLGSVWESCRSPGPRQLSRKSWWLRSSYEADPQFLRQFTPPTLEIDASQNRHTTRVLAVPTCAPSSTTPIEKDHLPVPSINDGSVSPPATPMVRKPTTCVNDHNQTVIPPVPPEHSSPPSTQPAKPATPPPDPLELSRPRPATKAPKKYEPETGHWL